MRFETLRRSLLVGLTASVLSCAANDPGGVTGSAGSGASAGTGGMATAGTSGTGATGGTGGSGDTSGAAGVGEGGSSMGTTGTGGASATGGTSATGGASATGGSGGGARGGAAGTSSMAGTAGAIAGTTGTAGGWSWNRIGPAAGRVRRDRPPSSNALVTSASGAFWKTGTWTESTASATVTVNDANTYQTWEGFGGAFNEKGWSYLTSQQMKDQAIALLFGKDGCNFAWGRIPIGASDYAMDRYSLNETAGDTAMSKFSIARDKMKLIPYIKAAQAVKSNIRFWASPWSPPTWMKTGPYNPNTGASHSNFDGGVMKSDDATLKAFALYLVKFVQAYAARGHQRRGRLAAERAQLPAELPVLPLGQRRRSSPSSASTWGRR